MNSRIRAAVVAAAAAVCLLGHSQAFAHGSTLGEGLRLVGSNPVRSSGSVLAFRINHSMRNVDLTVFDLAGRRAQELFHGDLGAGEHRFVFSGRDLAAGTYMVRLTTEHGLYKKTIAVVH